MKLIQNKSFYFPFKLQLLIAFEIAIFGLYSENNECICNVLSQKFTLLTYTFTITWFTTSWILIDTETEWNYLWKKGFSAICPKAIHTSYRPTIDIQCFKIPMQCSTSIISILYIGKWQKLHKFSISTHLLCVSQVSNLKCSCLMGNKFIGIEQQTASV